MLSSRISDYPTITQGKTRIPGVNDAEELESLDVSLANPWFLNCSAHAHWSYFLVQNEQAVIHLTIQLPYYIELPGLKCRCKNVGWSVSRLGCQNVWILVTLPFHTDIHSTVLLSPRPLCASVCVLCLSVVLCVGFYLCFCVNFKPM